MTVFEIDQNWDRVFPVLHNPLAEKALDVGMTEWCRLHCGSFPWKPDFGPWWHYDGDSPEWKYDFPYPWSDKVEEYRQWRKQQPLPLRPERDTPDWYRCWKACHCLVGWNCAIGQLLKPQLEWSCVRGGEHSTAIGMSADENEVVCFDILCGHTCTYDAIFRSIRPIKEWVSLEVWLRQLSR